MAFLCCKCLSAGEFLEILCQPASHPFYGHYTGQPSVGWRCWLGGRKGIGPERNRVVGCWGMVICLERGADSLVAQLMPLPLTVSCFSKVQIGLLFWYRLTWVVPEKGPLNRCVYRSTCISWHLLLRIGVFLVAKFYCPCALADDCAVSQNHNFFGI